MLNLILSGKSNSGKTTTAKVIKDLFSFESNCTYTTRNKRRGEIEGIDNHFVSKEKFEKMIEDGLFAEYADFPVEGVMQHYGSLKSFYQSGNNTVTILSPEGIRQLKKNGMDIVTVYLRVDTDILRDRAIQRGDRLETIEERFERDAKDFQNFENEADIIIDVEEDESPEVIASRIMIALYDFGYFDKVVYVKQEASPTYFTEMCLYRAEAELKRREIKKLTRKNICLKAEVSALRNSFEAVSKKLDAVSTRLAQTELLSLDKQIQLDSIRGIVNDANAVLLDIAVVELKENA